MTTHQHTVQVGQHECVVDLELEELSAQVEGPKRLRLPYVLRWKCPNCGHPREEDYGCGEQFGYKMLPGEYEEGLYCTECDFEFKVKVKLNLSMEIVDE